MRSALAIYLDDHAAGAAVGSSLARRLAANNTDTAWHDELCRIADEIEEDAVTLARVRDQLHVEGGTAKRVLALAAERVSRLKLNGQLTGYSPVSRVEEVEGLMAGVAAKQRAWAALHAGLGSRPPVDDVDFGALEARAGTQLERLGEFHQQAAAVAFGERPECLLPPRRPSHTCRSHDV